MLPAENQEASRILMRSTNNLTFLRWVGASLVLVGHAHTFLGLPEPLFLGHITLGPLGVFMFFSMANVGLPGTSGFVGEFLTLMGIFQVNTWVALFATSGVILSAAYALWLYRRVVFGELVKESLKTISDMTTREKAIFAPLVAMTLLLGVYPSLVTDLIGPSVAHLVQNYHADLGTLAQATAGN
mgnify:CR=1 FL=1